VVSKFKQGILNKVQSEIRRTTEQSTNESKRMKEKKAIIRYAPKPLWKQKQNMMKTSDLENFADELQCE
jgi:hypothetical protein